MSLEAGQKLSHYEILEPIGRGGMGEVYRARDTKLGRDVAIKVLPEEFSQDDERVRRFQREAKVLASLNHANIAAIYGLERSGSTHYLVLELVEGETLAERIGRGAIPLDEALPYAMKIAEALEEAHERGIIHRDLKPANIKITPRDEIKVLDFGLAKAFAEESAEVDSSMSPTITRDATRVGVILGTAAYMSPEQAKGKHVDKRTDIFAFGAVVYEMLSGRKAFPGDDVSEVLAAVIKLEPDWSALPRNLPNRMVDLLKRCLEKRPGVRRRDIGDVRIELSQAGFEPAPESRSTKRRPWQAIAVSALAGALVGGAVISGFRSAPAPDDVVMRFELPLDADIMGPAAWQNVAISPDGRRLVYAAGAGGLYVRDLDEVGQHVVPGTAQRRSPEPFFSPDGNWIGFHRDGRLQRVAVRGGEPVTLCEIEAPDGVSWSEDHDILFALRGKGIYRVSSAGGTPEVVLAVDGSRGETASGPQRLPDGRAILYTLTSADDALPRVVVQSPGSEDRRTLITGGRDARFVPPGFLVYASGNTLMGARFDVRRNEIQGTPLPVVDGVETDFGVMMRYAVSTNGTLVYGRDEAANVTASWIDRSGASEKLPMPARAYRFPRISPDGTSIVARIERDLWIYDIERGLWSRLTSTGDVSRVVWSRDARSVLFSSNRNGVDNIYRQHLDAIGSAEQLTFGKWNEHPDAVSPDGRTLVFHVHDGRGVTDLWSLELDGASEPRVLIQSEFNDRAAALSPDGARIAYTSDERGGADIYIKRVDGHGERVLVSPGFAPVWSPDGRELFFVHDRNMMSVSIEGEDALRVGPPRRVFDASAYWLRVGPMPNFDIAPDGDRFFVLGGDGSYRGPTMQVVVNWTTELERLLSQGDD